MLQAMRILPTTGNNNNNNNSIVYESITFTLNTGPNNKSSTLVTFPSPSVTEIAQASGEELPVIQVAVIDQMFDLSPRQNTSKV